MANLPGNPYEDMPSNYEAGELTNAIMALAFEQRTANLIAFTMGGVTAGADGPGVEKQLRNIGTRLGAE
jgi:hypothetical protein